MPHIILEYPQDRINDETIDVCLDRVHKAVADTDLFDVSHIRIRAIPLNHYRVGGEKQPFIHVQCRIHAGRSDQQKKELTEMIIAALTEQVLGVEVMTAEAVELDRASYAKYIK